MANGEIQENASPATPAEHTAVSPRLSAPLPSTLLQTAPQCPDRHRPMAPLMPDLGDSFMGRLEARNFDRQ